jgi:hypothetical protein
MKLISETEEKPFASSLKICPEVSVERDVWHYAYPPNHRPISQLIGLCFIYRRRHRYSPPSRYFLHVFLIDNHERGARVVFVISVSIVCLEQLIGCERIVIIAACDPRYTVIKLLSIGHVFLLHVEIATAAK